MTPETPARGETRKADTSALGFTLEQRGPYQIIVWESGGCRGANSTELRLLDALAESQSEVQRQAAEIARLTAERDEMRRDRNEYKLAYEGCAWRKEGMRKQLEAERDTLKAALLTDDECGMLTWVLQEDIRINGEHQGEMAWKNEARESLLLKFGVSFLAGETAEETR